MTLEEENKALRDRWFADHWNDTLQCEDVSIPDGALVLQQMGLIPTIKLPGAAERNMIFRNQMFAACWDGVLRAEDLILNDGARLLQEAGVIPTVP